MGFIGKAGVGVAGIAPVAFAGIEALGPWTISSWGPFSIRTKLMGSAAAFVNTLSYGFGLGETIPASQVSLGDPAGLISVPTAGYAGAWLKTTTVGISLVVIDGVIGTITRLAAGGRTRPKFMGRQAISG